MKSAEGRNVSKCWRRVEKQAGIDAVANSRILAVSLFESTVCLFFNFEMDQLECSREKSPHQGVSW